MTLYGFTRVTAQSDRRRRFTKAAVLYSRTTAETAFSVLKLIHSSQSIVAATADLQASIEYMERNLAKAAKARRRT